MDKEATRACCQTVAKASSRSSSRFPSAREILKDWFALACKRSLHNKPLLYGRVISRVTFADGLARVNHAWVKQRYELAARVILIVLISCAIWIRRSGPHRAGVWKLRWGNDMTAGCATILQVEPDILRHAQIPVGRQGRKGESPVNRNHYYTRSA